MAMSVIILTNSDLKGRPAATKVKLPRMLTDNDVAHMGKYLTSNNFLPSCIIQLGKLPTSNLNIGERASINLIKTLAEKRFTAGIAPMIK